MANRKDEVAALAGVAIDHVHETNVYVVRHHLNGKIDPLVLTTATQEPATYWRVGDRYFLDDPLFGDVVEMTNLAYNIVIGLHPKQEG